MNKTILQATTIEPSLYYIDPSYAMLKLCCMLLLIHVIRATGMYLMLL